MLHKKYDFINTFYVTKLNKYGLSFFRKKYRKWDVEKVEDIRFVGLDNLKCLVFYKSGIFCMLSGNYYPECREETGDYNIDWLKENYKNYNKNAIS